jgi:hypothetical protein
VGSSTEIARDSLAVKDIFINETRPKYYSLNITLHFLKLIVVIITVYGSWHLILGKERQKAENPLIFLKETFGNPLLL